MDKAAVAYQLLNYLKSCGVEVLYGVTGDTIFPLLSAIGEQEEIKFITTSHEVNAAYMACYQAKLTGKVGICLATSGPGAANLVNGLAEAYFDKNPVLAITGQVSLKKLGTGAKQYINQQKLLGGVTESTELITDGEVVVPAIASALSRAVNYRTVTHISIPEDIFTQTMNNSDVPVVDLEFMGEKRYLTGKFEEAVSNLQKTQKLLLVIGERVERGLIEELADKTNGAVIIAQQAKGVIPDKHPRVIGGIGQAYVPELLNEADGLFLIGSAPYEMKFLPPGLNTVQLSGYPEKIDYQRSNIPLIGEINVILKELLERIGNKEIQQPAHKTWMDRINQEKSGLKGIVDKQLKNKNNPIHPAHLMAVLSKTVSDNALIICDIGSFIHWFDTYFQAEKQMIMVSTNWRSMGSSLPGGLSACLHFPDRQIIVITGDGGLLMSISELSTAVKYKLPVKVVVANNYQYQLEKSRMEIKGLTPHGYDLKTPDFARVAEAYGVRGIKIEDAQELKNSLQDGIDTDGPVLIDVHLSQDPLPGLS